MTSQIIISSTFAKAEDVNFCFPIPERIENDRIAIVPFHLSKHLEAYLENTKDDDYGVFNYLPIGPFKGPNAAEQFIHDFWNGVMFPNRNNVLFAVLNKTSDGQEELAASVAYINTSAFDLITEIGYVTTFPKFQRTHVTSNMCGLLLHYALDLPKHGGLGLRRVQWFANSLNQPSLRAAERLGFKLEGIFRWHRVLPASKALAANSNGKAIRNGDPRGVDCPGRDSAVFSLCFEDWESGGKESIDSIMARRN